MFKIKNIIFLTTGAAIFFVSLILSTSQALTPQPRSPAYISADGQHLFQKRVHEIRSEKVTKGGIVFAGDSITEGCDWNNTYPHIAISNQGIGYDTSDGLLTRLSLITEKAPRTVLLMIGTNDIGYGLNASHIAQNIRQASHFIQQNSPGTQIIVQSILPQSHVEASHYIASVNQIIQSSLAKDPHLNRTYFINISAPFKDMTGALNTHLTTDGIHLNEKGCAVWAAQLTNLLSL